MSIAAVESRIQACRQAVGQLQEMLRMEFSADLCPMVDILVAEARDEVGHLQQAGEVCVNEGRFDLVEQLTGMVSDLEDIQRRAEVWKSGGGPGGGGGGLGRTEHMTDDERMARELAAQFEEEERAASAAGTPAASTRSHRSAREEEDQRFARELAAAEGQSVSAPEAPATTGPSRGEEAFSPELSQAAPGGAQNVDRASEGSDSGGGGRRKEKKKKREKEDAWGGDAFAGGASDGGGFDAGWPGGGVSNCDNAVAGEGAGAADGGFQADFGAFGSGGGGWADGGRPAFPAAAPGGAQEFGAFGGGGSGDFPASSKPTAAAFGSSDAAGFPAAADSAPVPPGTFAGGSPGADFGAFRDAPRVEAPAAAFASPLTKIASQDSWGGSSGTGKRGWGSSAVGETLTMNIRRPFAEIADNMEGFTTSFIRDIANAMGISEQRIRVQAVRPS